MRSLGLLGIVLLGCAASTPPAATGPGKATDFALRDLEGRDVHLSDYLGRQVVLLDFWATWCVPCEAALPHIEALYKEHKDHGFVVLGIAMDDSQTVAKVAPFAQRYGLSFPVLLDEETRAVQIYNPKKTAPFQVLIDRHGSIARVRQGFNAGDEKLLAAEVAALLAQK